VGFKRLSLEPGQAKTVTFRLHTHQLGRYDDAVRYMVQPGTVEVLVGRSAGDIRLAGQFRITGPALDVTDRKVFFSEVTVT
jgi:beta-glucosidase